MDTIKLALWVLKYPWFHIQLHHMTTQAGLLTMHLIPIHLLESQPNTPEQAHWEWKSEGKSLSVFGTQTVSVSLAVKGGSYISGHSARCLTVANSVYFYPVHTCAAGVKWSCWACLYIFYLYACTLSISLLAWKLSPSTGTELYRKISLPTTCLGPRQVVGRDILFQIPSWALK